jgi:hypothetical protein
MEFRDFCYWLQGYLELKNKDDVMSIQQISIIQQHLNLVLNKHPHMGSLNNKNIIDDINNIMGPRYCSAVPNGPTGPKC